MKQNLNQNLNQNLYIKSKYRGKFSLCYIKPYRRYRKIGDVDMELQDELLEEKKKPKKVIEKNKVSLEKDSIQYNAQDLDQEQKVDVNPVQLNTQNFNVLLSNYNFSGRIAGTTYLEKNKEIADKVDILLFFGHELKLPVYKTNSDKNGNFIIEDIPAGYYTLVAKLGDNLKYQSHYIKVLPCQNVHQSILLK